MEDNNVTAATNDGSDETANIKKRGNDHLKLNDPKPTKKRQEEENQDDGRGDEKVVSHQTNQIEVKANNENSALLLCQEIKANNIPSNKSNVTDPHQAVNNIKKKTKRIDSHHSVLPLSMQIMKPFWVLCCQNCERTRNGRLDNDSSSQNVHNVNHSTPTTTSANHAFSSSVPTSRESVPSFISRDGHVIMEGLNDNSTLPFESTHQPILSDNTPNGNANEDHLANESTDESYPIQRSNDDLPTPQDLQKEIKIYDELHHVATIPPTPKSHTNPIMQEYISTVQIYGCQNVNAGVLTTIRFSLPTLRVSGAFHDSDMLALSEILFRHCNGALSHIKRLDFSVASREGKLHGRRGFGSHGAFTLSRVLCISKYIEEVFVQRNRIGPYGAASMFAAASKNPVLKTLVMRRCLLGERGALAFVEYIGQSQVTGLKEVDLSVNRIGFRGSITIEELLKEREKNGQGIDVDLEGNLVLQEVMNGITHGLGIVLAFIGASLLSNRVKDSSQNHRLSCGIYSASLLVLYTSSTLYHSFFALKYTRYIFEVLDHCAIYILITGSYTPFIRIALEHSPTASFYLLLFQWTCCMSGIFVEAFYTDWAHKPKFTLAMYLGMGWACMSCMPQFMEVLPKEAIQLVVMGGVGYTSGVPFFVRNNNLDHSIWHCFVLAGSFFHWLAIYQYVAPLHSSCQNNIGNESLDCLAPL